jgi:hypothetical protein
MSLKHPAAGSYVAFALAASVKISEQVASGILHGEQAGAFSAVADAKMVKAAEARVRDRLAATSPANAEAVEALANELAAERLNGVRQLALLSALLDMFRAGRLSQAALIIELERLCGMRPRQPVHDAKTVNYVRRTIAVHLCAGAMLNHLEPLATHGAAARYLNAAGGPSAQVTDYDIRHALSSFEGRYGWRQEAAACDAALYERAMRSAWTRARRTFPNVRDESALAERVADTHDFALAFDRSGEDRRAFRVDGRLLFVRRGIAILEAEQARRAA